MMVCLFGGLSFLLSFSCSVVPSSLRLHERQHARLPYASLSAGVESVMPSNRLILCCPLLLLPSIFPNISLFSNESAVRIRWPKCWSFSFSISPQMNIQGWFLLGWTGCHHEVKFLRDGECDKEVKEDTGPLDFLLQAVVKSETFY